MIITKELVVSLHRIGLLCDVGLEYILANGYIGMTRSAFIKKTKKDIAKGTCRADYLPWTMNTLVKSELIKRHSNFKPTGNLRVSGIPTIFNSIDDAKVALEEIQNNNIEKSYLFCIEEEIKDDTSPEDVLLDWRILKI